MHKAICEQSMYPWLIDHYRKLAQRVNSQSLHHALIIKGYKGIGKQIFSLQIAQFILCQNKVSENPCGQCQSCLLFNAESHPDFHRIESDKQIGVDLIREAIQKLVGKAQLSGNKVLVMLGADSMTEASANALLKTLEEPTKGTYLILVCDQPERLLPTILSRCEKIQLHPPEASVCQRWLEENGCHGVDDDFIKLYSNAPLTIKQRLDNEKAISYQAFLNVIGDLQANNKQSAEVATQWVDDTADMLNWLKHLISESLRVNQSDELWMLYKECLSATQVCVNPGINKALLLTGILESISFIKTDLIGAHRHAG